MTQTYRTDDFARWGAGQGFNLSPTQVDINFWDLVQRMLAQEARPDASAAIVSFEIVGVMMYVHMSDGHVFGPYELPMAIFRDRGEWAPNVPYSKMDTFSANGGLYVVIFDHTSGTTFDPGANNGAGSDYYQLMIQTPGSSLPSGGAVGHSLLKATTTDYSVMWGGPDASTVLFTPATGSTLSSLNVADALEELADESFSGDAADVAYEPSTASGLTSTNVQDALDELGESGGGGGGGGATGRKTIWVPASAMVANTTNGPSAGTVETSTAKIMIRTLNFDPSTLETAQFDVVLPKSWDLGPLRFRVFWSHAATTTDFGVEWCLQGSAYQDGASLDYHGFMEVPVDDVGGLANTIYCTAESAYDMPIDTAGTLAFGNYIVFRVYRSPTASGDSMAIDARLHGVQIYYNTNAATDD